MNQEMAEKFRSGKGFIAALDQSGGSTPKALKLYGIQESEYSGEEQMFDLVHQMRSRIITNSAFNGDRVLAAILFEGTMDRDIEGVGTAEYLWKTKNIVPVVMVTVAMNRNDQPELSTMPPFCSATDAPSDWNTASTSVK